MRNNQTTNAAAPKHEGRRFRAMFLLSLVALAAVMFASLSLGSSTIGATDVAAFVAGNASDMANNVLANVRVPRVLGGVLAGAFAKRLFLRRGTAALWCITAVCALLGLAVLPCVPAAAGYIAVTALAFCMMAAAALFQILLFTAIQAHAPTGQTGRFMSLITVCACLTQPVGQAAFGLLYGRFAALPGAVLFAAAAASIFINIAASHIFKKAVSFTKS